MTFLREIRTFLTAVCLFHGICALEFDFPNGVKSEPSCCVEDQQGRWFMEGTLNVEQDQMENFEPRVLIKIDNEELCSIDLNRCSYDFQAISVDACFCRHQEGNEYMLVVRQLARISVSEKLLTAEVPRIKAININETTVNNTFDIGAVPVIHELQEIKSTYQVNNGEAENLIISQDISVCRYPTEVLKICVNNRFAGSTLKAIVDGVGTQTEDECLLVELQFNLTKSFDVVVSFEAAPDCHRLGFATISVTEKPEAECRRGVLGVVNVPFNGDVCVTLEHQGRRAYDMEDADLPVASGQAAVCQTLADGTEWVVIQRRASSHVDFFQDWNAYKKGFGSLLGNFWYGLDKIYQLCNPSSPCELRFDLGKGSQEWFAIYGTFYLNDTSCYRLRISDYNSTSTTRYERMGYHNNYCFTTYDADWLNNNCARTRTGAWWFRGCSHVHLNGVWGSASDHGLYWYSVADRMTFSEMKVRPKLR